MVVFASKLISLQLSGFHVYLDDFYRFFFFFFFTHNSLSDIQFTVIIVSNISKQRIDIDMIGCAGQDTIDIFNIMRHFFYFHTLTVT